MLFLFIQMKNVSEFCFPGDKLEPLYAPIRHKLANALNNWHPSDSSAKVILQPWVNVFKAGHMEGFLVKNIVPKLELCMQEFVINPHQQILGKCFFFFFIICERLSSFPIYKR